jgi:hypothetical protein
VRKSGRKQKQKKNAPGSGAVSEEGSYQGTAFSRAIPANKNTPALVRDVQKVVQ